MNTQTQYQHKEYIKCIEVGTFAKFCRFKDQQGKVIGRNKLFIILRQLGIINRQNEPYQSCLSYIKLAQKKVYRGEQFFLTSVPLITPEGQEYLRKRIEDYLK